jgi:AraC family transcriptional regulator of adaptative response/methylated-DNA-[protein]-cysteine methyltransferase
MRGFAEALMAGYRPCKRCHPLGVPAAGGEVVHVARVETPIGEMIGAATADHLVMLEFPRRRMMRSQFARLIGALHCTFVPGDNRVLALLRAQLEEYFAGGRRDFDIPMRAPGTPFQSLVWNALQRIPHGATRSYAEIAAAIGRPTSVRAVARANGDNRIAILIPCHRVIGSDGSLTGYGGGLWRKEELLEREAGVH